MSDIKQLKLVADWEQDKEDKLARDFQQAQQYWQLNKNKLAGLQNYRLDYLRQIQQKASTGVGAMTFGQHHSFIGKLDKACEDQSRIIAQAKLVADQRRSQWLVQQRKRKAVELLIEKHLQQQALKQQKDEQKMLDEIATQRFIRRRTSF